MPESVNASDLTSRLLEKLELAGVEFQETPELTSLPGIARHAEVAWDAMIVWNALRPDETERNLSRFGHALDAVVSRIEATESQHFLSTPIVQRVRLYQGLASAGQKLSKGGRRVPLEELKDAARSHR